MKKSILGTAVVSAFALAGTANAAIITGELTGGIAFDNGGVFQESIPVIVGNNHQDSNNLFAFNENQGVALDADVGGLTAGTLVNSHYVFFDPLARGTTGVGYVDFDGEIIGVLSGKADMDATDTLLGLGAVNYVSVSLRGLEAADSFNVVGNRLNIDFRASSPGDYIRVLTAPVPEPSTWAMMIGGFGLVGGAMRRRRKMTTKVSYA
ncbi:PEP-CTERM protein-sorting domain-containing protein [Parasphingorhabdus marina DSM 22363]|uniref:PEP-CTERM protein-sorting domain-containing protein n=1 Tax=Parasphingorhabdus marina DSM 22363 TaxID=1123272 RepID=A0A1N6HA16_9SPHN|nr:PEPxxWA-CTERM sorting domain-containing protein [Parasphingorhabdus marina]SIO16668.1 PEP-CTERM protein-sorting domain-containing protein [Parasphingorhabdus marina DSM 22363]